MGDGRRRRDSPSASRIRVGDLLARLFLAVVDAGHDPIGLGQHVVGQVQPALLQDVALDALEHREAAAELVVQPVDLRPLGQQPLRDPARWPSSRAASGR